MTLHLPKTKLALANYDKLLAAFHSLDINSSLRDDVSEAIDRAVEEVGEAFAQETADRNSYENARLIIPCPWLRRLVEKYG